MNCLKSKSSESDWVPGETPTDRQKRNLLGNVLATAADVVMSHHTYIVGADANHQNTGAPIGLEAAGAISRAVMMMWDETLLQ